MQKPAAGLILESSFPSIGAVAKFHYGGLPVHWLLGAEFTLIDRLPQLSLPKLIIHGDQDDIIPHRTGPPGLRGGQATQILLRHSRRRPQQHLPGRGRGLFPTMGRIHPGGPPVIGCAQARRARLAGKARSEVHGVRSSANIELRTSNPRPSRESRFSRATPRFYERIDWRLPRHLRTVRVGSSRGPTPEERRDGSRSRRFHETMWVNPDYS